MSNIINEIFKILRECHPTNDEDCAKALSEKHENDTEDRIREDTEKLLAKAMCNVGSVEYSNLNKMLAICYLKARDEIKAVYHLIESHAVVLRQQVLHRYLKTEMRESVLNVSQTFGLKAAYVNFSVNKLDKEEAVISKLTELPHEWYMVQVTAQHESPDIWTHVDSMSSVMHPIHISILPTGCNEMQPFCITLPCPKLGTSYDVCQEIKKLLSNNRTELEATYANNELYWKMRERQNSKMKEAVYELEYTWLREWRILFMADPVDNDESVLDLMQMIEKLIADSKMPQSISKQTKWLLKKVAVGSCFLTRNEIARAVKYVLPCHEKLAINITLSLYGKLACIQTLRTATRKTLVLIVDEHMDYLPFETMETLKSHPVTRFPSLHIAYALFKEHESTMENGCKVIKAKNDMGTCIVNPSGNLTKMEKRMKLFIEYWLPHWKAWYHVEPKEEIFEDALVNHDILMYNGHGSGIQYLSGEQIEKLRVKAIVLLFGCSSVKLLAVGGRFPPYGVSNQYLIASSPCVLGMLWEVTDADIDKMTANFISSWIPSACDRPWSEVDTNAWCSGTLKFKKNQQNDENTTLMEPEMLRAVAKSKEACSQYMTAAAIVVRGLPIRLV